MEAVSDQLRVGELGMAAGYEQTRRCWLPAFKGGRNPFEAILCYKEVTSASTGGLPQRWPESNLVAVLDELPVRM